MDETYQKFTVSKQEPLRLSIALEGFLREETGEEARAAYREYLRRRIQPAAAALIEADDAAGLACLAAEGWLTGKLTDDLLRTAREKRKTAALVWLLRWKGEQYGFHDRDLSL